jgi:hypothetical protein
MSLKKSPFVSRLLRTLHAFLIFPLRAVYFDYGITVSLVIVIVTDEKQAGLKKQEERKLTPSESTGFRDITRSKEGNVQ